MSDDEEWDAPSAAEGRGSGRRTTWGEVLFPGPREHGIALTPVPDDLDFYDDSRALMLDADDEDLLEEFWTSEMAELWEESLEAGRQTAQMTKMKGTYQKQQSYKNVPTPSPVFQNSLCGLRALVPLPESIREDLAGPFQVLWEIFPDIDPGFLLHKLQSRKMDLDHWALEFTTRSYKTIQARLREMEVERKREEYLCDWEPERVAVAMTEELSEFITDRDRPPTPLYMRHARVALRNHFSALAAHNIERVLSANNFHYFPTFHQIQNMVTESGGAMFDRSGLFKIVCDRVPETWPEIIDEYFFIEFQYTKNPRAVDEILAKQRTKERRRRKARATRQSESASCSAMCDICVADSITAADLVACADGHTFCKHCLNRQAQTAAGNGVHWVECVWVGCSQEFSLGFLRGLVEEETVERLCRLDQLENLRLAALPDLVHCPFCVFAAEIPPDELELQCLHPKCLKRSCRFCSREGHVGLSCEAVSEQDRVARLRNFIQDKMSERIKRKCPSCTLACIKTDGCNHMTCIRCKTEFCYICAAVIEHMEEELHYAPGKCPRMSTEISLHVIPAYEEASAAHEKYLEEHPELRDVGLEEAGVHLEKLDIEAHRRMEREIRLMEMMEDTDEWELMMNRMDMEAMEEWGRPMEFGERRPAPLPDRQPTRGRGRQDPLRHLDLEVLEAPRIQARPVNRFVDIDEAAAFEEPLVAMEWGPAHHRWPQFRRPQPLGNLALVTPWPQEERPTGFGRRAVQQPPLRHLGRGRGHHQHPDPPETAWRPIRGRRAFPLGSTNLPPAMSNEARGSRPNNRRPPDVRRSQNQPPRRQRTRADARPPEPPVAQPPLPSEEMGRRRYPMGGWGRGRVVVRDRPASPRPGFSFDDNWEDTIERELNAA